MPQTASGYSDYTSMQTALSTGLSYDITLSTGDFFPHNFAAWIDYDHDMQFQADERIGLETLGFNNMSSTWSFVIPADAMNGQTRLRVRAMAEPFGAWTDSHHPCVPVGDGETEDYSVMISGGLSTDGAIERITAPVNAVGMSNETVSVKVANRGNTTISGATLELFIDGSSVAVESIAGSIAPGAIVDHDFVPTVDLNGITCHDIEVQLSVAGDADASNDAYLKQVCSLEPNVGSEVWYVHSNQFQPIETLDQGTTNETTMNTVFGAGNWQLGYFETMNVAQVFSPNTCVIFIDGSYRDVDPLETFLSSNIQVVEDWVAAGGHLFMNSSPESFNTNGNFVMDWGFDGIHLVQGYDIGYAIPSGSHPIHTGPFQPVGSEWSAFNYSEGVLYGDGLMPIIVDNDDDHFLTPELSLPLVAEKSWGSGTLIFGVIGASQLFFNPTESMNSRFNILDHLYECSISTGIDEAESIDLSVYPNPFTSQVNISLEGEIIEMVSLTNSLGQVVLRKNIGSVSRSELYVSNLSVGTYILLVEDASGKQYKSLVMRSH